MGKNSFGTEEKVRILLDGMRCPGKVTELYRQVDINRSTYCQWQKSLLQKRREGLANSRNGPRSPTSPKSAAHPKPQLAL